MLASAVVALILLVITKRTSNLISALCNYLCSLLGVCFVCPSVRAWVARPPPSGAGGVASPAAQRFCGARAFLLAPDRVRLCSKQRSRERPFAGRRLGAPGVAGAATVSRGRRRALQPRVRLERGSSLPEEDEVLNTHS